MITTHQTNMGSAHYARMGKRECEEIHLASLEILNRVGLDVHDEKALQLLVKGGAKADGIRVRIPEFMVSRALSVVPHRMNLYNRNGPGRDARGRLQHLLRRRVGLPQHPRPSHGPAPQAGPRRRLRSSDPDGRAARDRLRHVGRPARGRRPAHLRPLPDGSHAEQHDQADRVRDA